MRKLGLWGLAVMAAAGCSSEPGEAPSAADPGGSATRTQLRAFEDLKALSNRPWVWVQHDRLQTPMHLSADRVGAPVLRRGADPVRTTLDVLETHRKLFRMRDPSVELAEKKTATDAHGNTHARFQQVTHGIPVAGAGLVAHYDAEGRLASIDASYVADLGDLDVEPAFSGADALALVRSDILARTVHRDGTPLAASELSAGDAKLVVHAPALGSGVAGAPPRLAYELRVRALDAKEPAIWVTTVDARTGEVLHRYNNLQTIEAQGTGVLGDSKKFQVTANGATGFVMIDSAGGAQIRTYTAGQVEAIPGAPVTSQQQNSWDTGVPGAGAAVDAHFNAATVFKYYKDRFQRSSIDGAGGPLVSTVHFGEAFDNAAWTGEGMIYGDGGTMFRALSVGLDVVAHEFTHGVTEEESGLVYENQPGALNEAISDIFAAFIEHASAPDETKNWTIGEALPRTGPPLRNMKTPGAVEQPQPSHMSRFVNTQQDNGGVHINSGIINNAAWLMTVGGTNPVSKTVVKFGIGWEKSEKLWYQASTKYFMRTTNFTQAAQDVLQAAKDIALTANETAIVECALRATGLQQGACSTAIVDPQAKIPTAPAPDGTAAPGGAGEAEEPDDEETTPSTTPKTRRRRVVTQSEGCSATAAPGGSRAASLGAAALVALAVAAARRKRR